MKRTFFALLLALSAGHAAGENAGVPENPIYKDLVERGIKFSDGKAVMKLPPPLLADNLDAAAQWAAIEKVRMPAIPPRIWSPTPATLRWWSGSARFCGRRARAPPVRAVDLWFVAHGDWDILTSQKFLESALKTGQGPSEIVSKSGSLTDQELAKRDLRAADRGGYEERFVYSTFSLFDRVELSATRRVVLVRAKDSILAAGKVDRRFDKDRDYPNQWRPLVRDAQANIIPGARHPFDRAGGYAKITRLISPAGAVFIECHLVYEEDYGWFDGANLVKEKIPAMVQEKVRTFRRKLNVATEKNAGKKGA